MITISGGAFQDAEGNVLASGTLQLQLGFDAQYSASNVVTGIIAAGSIIKITLDANGNAPSTSIVSNAEMSPSGNYYRATLYNSKGQSVFAYPQIWIFNQTTGQSVNLNTIVPASTAPVSSPSLVLQTNEVNNGSQSTLDLHAGTGITLTDNGAGRVTVAASGTGTVTSVGLAMPAEFTVTGSPVTGAGTLTAAKANQSANQVYAGPASGGAAAPGFRALVPADVPVFVASGTNHAAGAVPDPGAVAGTTKFLREDATWQVPAGGSGSAGASLMVFPAGIVKSLGSGWGGYSLCLKLPGRNLLSMATAFKLGFNVGATGAMTIQGGVVYTTANDSLVITAVNTITWGGSATPSLNPGENLSDAISLTFANTNDYYFVVMVNSTTTNSTLNGYDISSLSGTAVTVGSVAFWGMGGYVHANEIGLIVGNSIPTASFAGTQTAITKLVSA